MAKAGYREKRIRPVWPIYLAGVVFLLYSAIFPVYKTSHFFIGLFLALVAFVAGTMVAPVKVEEVEVEYKTGDGDADAIIENGRKIAARLRDESERITDFGLKQDVIRTEQALTRMVDTVAQTPAKARHVKKFVNYYLPTITKLLDAYDQFKQTGSPEQTAGIMDSIKASMKNVADASEKQFETMFKDEEMDISTDIEVLDTLLKSDGLIGEDPFADRKADEEAAPFRAATSAAGAGQARANTSAAQAAAGARAQVSSAAQAVAAAQSQAAAAAQPQAAAAVQTARAASSAVQAAAQAQAQQKQQ